MKLAFDLDEVKAFLVVFVFYISYFLLALPASWMLKRTGMKKGMALSLLVMAVGAALFGEFSTQRVYAGALTGLFVIGGGLAMLQTAVNPYISILGPIESAAQRIAVMGICNKVAGMLAPLLIGTLVLHGIGDLATQVGAADAATKATLLNEFAAQDPYPVPGDGRRAGAAGDRDPVFAAAGNQARRRQCRRADGAARRQDAACSSSRICGWACCASSSTSAWK